MTQTKASQTDIPAILQEEKEVVDKPDAKDLVITDGIIEFKDVTFSYDGKVDALHDVSFTVEKGESVALVSAMIAVSFAALTRVIHTGRREW